MNRAHHLERQGDRARGAEALDLYRRAQALALGARPAPDLQYWARLQAKICRIEHATAGGRASSPKKAAACRRNIQTRWARHRAAQAAQKGAKGQ